MALLIPTTLFILLLIVSSPSSSLANHHHHGHGHGHHHGGGGGGNHGHGPAEHRVQREHSQQGGPSQNHPPTGAHHSPGSASCDCGAPGRPFIGTQSGIPIFLFPDHAQKAVDVILGAEGAFYWDNDELAHRIFDLLAHKFPQKWFLVGVGNSPGNGLGLRVLKGSGQDLLHGTIKVSPGHSPFAFFDRRQFPRDNETQLWYFVRAIEPVADGDGGERERAKSMAQCVRKETKSCIPASLGSECALDFLALIDQNTQPALYASEPLSNNAALMKMLNSITQCTAENEGTRFYAIMAGGRGGDAEEEGEKADRKREGNGADEEN